MRSLPVVIGLMAVILVSSLAPASPRVAIAVEQDPALEDRLADELISAGYRTTSIPKGDAASPMAPASDDDIAIVLIARAHDGGYELWLRERATQDTVIRELVRTRDLSAVALRAVELVRVAVLEQKQRRPPRSVRDETLVPEKPATPEPRRPALEVHPPAPTPGPSDDLPPRRLEPDPSPYRQPGSPPPVALGSVELSGVWFHDAAGGQTSAGLEASGGIFYPRWVETRLRARYLLFMPSLAVGGAGTIDTRLTQAGVAVALHSVDPTASVSPFLEVGADFLWLNVRGNPSSPTLLGLRKNAFGVYPHVGPGVTIGDASFPLRLRAHLAIGAAVPRQRLIIVDDSRTWGWLTVDGTIGVQYLIP